MRTYHGSETLPRGVYFDLTTLEIVQRYSKEDRLAASPNDRLVKIPAVSAIAIGPLIGLVFLMFLPFIGIVGTAGLVARRMSPWSAGGKKGRAARQAVEKAA